MNERIYYIAEVSGKYNDTSNFVIRPFTGYIYESDGYLQVGESSRDYAKRWDEIPSDVSAIRKAGPWYYKIEDVRFIKVCERFEKEEEYVE